MCETRPLRKPMGESMVSGTHPFKLLGTGKTSVLTKFYETEVSNPENGIRVMEPPIRPKPWLSSIRPGKSRETWA